MTHSYCITSHSTLAVRCARDEDDARKHLLKRTYADFSVELIHQPDRPTTCLLNKSDAADRQARLH